MFQPFNYYSADFRVDLYSDSIETAQQRQLQTVKYVSEHKDFFQQFGITSTDDVRIHPLKFKVAQLIYDSADSERIISQIRASQYVNSVTIK
jgi:N-acetylglutamate synthase-like GNAT family acetyltransferase